MTEQEQKKAAALIDERLRHLHSQGFRDVALLSLMLEHARLFVQLRRHAPPEQLAALLHEYEGLGQFACLLSAAITSLRQPIAPRADSLSPLELRSERKHLCSPGCSSTPPDDRAGSLCRTTGERCKMMPVGGDED
jgi:hypothetical protein